MPIPNLKIKNENVEIKLESTGWPSLLSNIYVISINPNRYSNLLNRVGPWKTHFKLFEGTHGKNINIQKWINNKKYKPLGKNILMKGELGCHDSHVRLWKQILKGDNDISLILEDDVGLTYSEKHKNSIIQCLKEIYTYDIQWDIWYISHHKHCITKRVTEHLSIPKECQTFTGYAITKKGASKLLNSKFVDPYRIPVDMIPFKIPNLKQISSDPTICSAVYSISDTIKKY